MAETVGRVAALRRYPVKGLSPEPLDAVEVEAGRQFAGDRAYAIENGPSGFDPAPAKLPKTRFLCLMRNARLAGLKTRFDDTAHRLEVERDGALALSVDLSSEAGRSEAADWFTVFMGDELRGPLKVLPAPGRHTFSDTSKGVLSLINLASVSAIEDFSGAPVDPLRFRGNLDFEGFGAWEELDWLDREVLIGEARFRVVQRTVRCAATEVDPTTAERDMRIPKLLQQNLGHADCGVYAEPLTAGRIAVGDAIRLA
ncbi:MOSC domain-containing protein [Chenggangzhangella methanolivorans]|uniref:MOSC domain-containing protein n=1 Tax=Chenggangzhangella methanolivorans TaxID=1437009 RepID=A0A9E6RBQ5_9HYPH|nr:MOSC domain-containing protein [Chenggangzhangella methanolivorans]QZO01859.1 MOSC domain-containing protein [Chenggangzhangella methanolivorans]